MKNLPNIELTPQLCTDLIQNRRFSKGGESIICRPQDSNYTLYKIFTQPPPSSAITEMSENKLNKLRALYQKSLEYSLKPVSTISLDGRLIGYEMTYDPSFILLQTLVDNAALSRKEIITTLKQKIS